MRCDRGMNDELAALKALKADFSARTQLVHEGALGLESCDGTQQGDS